MNKALLLSLALCAVCSYGATAGQDLTSEAYITQYIEENQNERYETILMNFIAEHRNKLSRKQLEQSLNKIDQLEPYYITLRIYRSLCSIYKEGKSITVLSDEELQLIAHQLNQESHGFYPTEDVFQICKINKQLISDRLMRNYQRSKRDDWSCYEDFGDDETTTEPIVHSPVTPWEPVTARTIIPLATTLAPTAPPMRAPTTTEPAEPTPEATTTPAATTQKVTTTQTTTTEKATTEELCLGDCVLDTENTPTEPGLGPNGYDEDFLSQFTDIYFARQANLHYIEANKDKNPEFFEKCKYEVDEDLLENYTELENGVSIEYTLVNKDQHPDCPYTRKCFAKVEGNIYTVSCEGDDDIQILEDNLNGDGPGSRNFGGDGTSDALVGSGSGSGSGSGFSGSGDSSGDEPVAPISESEEAGWKLPLLIILIVLLVCACLAIVFCIVCKKNKNETQILEDQ